MQDAFAPGYGVPAGVTAEGHAAALAWTPPGFRAFDTGAADDDGVANDEGTVAPEPQTAAAETPPDEAPQDDGDDTDGEALQAGTPKADTPPDDSAAPAPVEAPQPMNARVPSIVESIDVPAVAERHAGALAMVVNVDTTPLVAASAPEAADPPAGDGSELVEIPAFLRRG